MKKNTIKKGYETPSSTTLHLRTEGPICASGDFESTAWSDSVIDNIADIDFLF